MDEITHPARALVARVVDATKSCGSGGGRVAALDGVSLAIETAASRPSLGRADRASRC